MEIGYYLLFGSLSVVVAFLELGKSSKERIKTTPAFRSFKNNYLFIYSLMMVMRLMVLPVVVAYAAKAGDWLQGPYVYYLYSTYGFGKGEIGQLFIAGFGSSMLFGTIVGSLADKQGRKRACVTYCVSYILSCITKHSPRYSILMLGRLLGGISTSLLCSAFESWLIAEHNKVRGHFVLGIAIGRDFERQWLPSTFSQAVFLGNGVAAILSGLLGNILVKTLSLGPVAPFDASAIILAIGMFHILSSWTENYGDPSESKDLLTQFKIATTVIASGIPTCPSNDSLFEGSMYTFVFLWTPALSPNEEEIPHGFIFATFMLSSMLGSSLASKLMARPNARVETYMQTVFIVSAISLALPMINFVIAPSTAKHGGLSYSGVVQLLGFCTFEGCVGIFWPFIMKMRSQFIPEEARSTIMNLFRIPLNIFVCIVLFNVDAFPTAVMFGMCSIFLLTALFLQKRIKVILDGSSEWIEDRMMKREMIAEKEPLNVGA